MKDKLDKTPEQNTIHSVIYKYLPQKSVNRIRVIEEHIRKALIKILVKYDITRRYLSESTGIDTSKMSKFLNSRTRLSTGLITSLEYVFKKYPLEQEVTDEIFELLKEAMPLRLALNSAEKREVALNDPRPLSPQRQTFYDLVRPEAIRLGRDASNSSIDEWVNLWSKSPWVIGETNFMPVSVVLYLEKEGVNATVLEELWKLTELGSADKMMDLISLKGVNLPKPLPNHRLPFEVTGEQSYILNSFIKHYLKMSYPQFAKLFNVSEGSMYSWTRGEKMSPRNGLLLAKMINHLRYKGEAVVWFDHDSRLLSTSLPVPKTGTKITALTLITGVIEEKVL